MRRIVITGMGLITSLGLGVETNWAKLISGQSGIKLINNFNVQDLPSKIAGTISNSIIDEEFNSKDKRRMDNFILFALIASNEAMKDSGWTPKNEHESSRAGVIIGSGIGGLSTIYNNSILLTNSNPRKISPFFIPSSLINLASGQVSIKYNLKGPNHSIVTACSSGAHAIGDSFKLIQSNKADVMIAGGAEAAVCRIGMAGFCALKALSTKFNNSPSDASRPFDKDRDGFVMGEGAGVLVLEELEHAKKRGAKIYGELTGYGANSDGLDMVSPSGEGAYRCMQMAWEMSDNKDIDYINAHGTSTPVGDISEIEAIRNLFLEKIPFISSTKSLSGHSLGAAGVHESIFSLIMLNEGFLSGSANIENLDKELEGTPILLRNKEMPVEKVLSNSFGFGGTNASLIFERYN